MRVPGGVALLPFEWGHTLNLALAAFVVAAVAFIEYLQSALAFTWNAICSFSGQFGRVVCFRLLFYLISFKLSLLFFGKISSFRFIVLHWIWN